MNKKKELKFIGQYKIGYKDRTKEFIIRLDTTATKNIERVVIVTMMKNGETIINNFMLEKLNNVAI